MVGLLQRLNHLVDTIRLIMIYSYIDIICSPQTGTEEKHPRTDSIISHMKPDWNSLPTKNYFSMYEEVIANSNIFIYTVVCCPID